MESSSTKIHSSFYVPSRAIRLDNILKPGKVLPDEAKKSFGSMLGMKPAPKVGWREAIEEADSRILKARGKRLSRHMQGEIHEDSSSALPDVTGVKAKKRRRRRSSVFANFLGILKRGNK
ncbi:hypothetical protein AAMO2058_000278400, partial [Amorphochlora amoebiformis]